MFYWLSSVLAFKIELQIPMANEIPMNSNENHSGISTQLAVMSLRETKINMEKTLYFKYLNFSNMFAKKK